MYRFSSGFRGDSRHPDSSPELTLYKSDLTETERELLLHHLIKNKCQLNGEELSNVSNHVLDEILQRFASAYFESIEQETAAKSKLRGFQSNKSLGQKMKFWAKPSKEEMELKARLEAAKSNTLVLCKNCDVIMAEYKSRAASGWNSSRKQGREETSSSVGSSADTRSSTCEPTCVIPTNDVPIMELSPDSNAPVAIVPNGNASQANAVSEESNANQDEIMCESLLSESLSFVESMFQVIEDEVPSAIDMVIDPNFTFDEIFYAPGDLSIDQDESDKTVLANAIYYITKQDSSEESTTQPVPLVNARDALMVRLAVIRTANEDSTIVIEKTAKPSQTESESFQSFDEFSDIRCGRCSSPSSSSASPNPDVVVKPCISSVQVLGMALTQASVFRQIVSPTPEMNNADVGEEEWE